MLYQNTCTSWSQDKKQGNEEGKEMKKIQYANAHLSNTYFVIVLVLGAGCIGISKACVHVGETMKNKHI